MHVAYGRGLGILLWGNEIPRKMGNFLRFLPFDNALYSIAFVTHTKTAEPIKIPFGLMTRVGHMYSVLDGHPIPMEEGSGSGPLYIYIFYL